MANKIFNNVTLSVKWKTASTRPEHLYSENGWKYVQKSLSSAPTGWPTDYFTDATGNSPAPATFASGTYYHKEADTTANAYVIENITTTIGNIAKYLDDLGTAAFVNTESTLTDGNNLPTGAAVKTFVEGKGYVTSSGVTSITPGDGIVDGSGNTTAITSTGTLKVALQNYTKSTAETATLTQPTASTKFYPVSLDKNGKLGAYVNWTDRYVNTASFADDTTSNSSNPVKMTLTRAGSDTSTVTANLPKVSSTSAGVAPKGSAVTTQSTTTKFLREDGTWQAPSYYTHPAGTAKNTQAIYKFKVDGTGHVTDASEVTVDTTVTQDSGNLVTSGAVWTAIDNLPEPMVFQGTVGAAGDSPTATSLPVDGTASVGDTYKVITAGTYGGQTAKVGDTLICNSKTGSANTWVLIPSGDDVEDTWRNIKVNGTEKLGTGISTGGVDFVNGTNTTVSFNATGNKIQINSTDTNTYVSGATFADDTTSNASSPVKLTLARSGSDTTSVTGNIPKVSSTSAGVAPKGAAVTTQTQTTKFLREDGTWSAPEYTTNTDRYVNSASFADDTTSNESSPVKLTLTRAGSDTETVTANLPKVSSTSAGVAPKGAAVTTQSATTKFLREDGTWAAPSYTTNTDTKVTQNVKSDNVNRGILLSNYNTSQDTTTADVANRTNSVYVNTSTNELTAGGGFNIKSGNYFSKLRTDTLSADATQTFPATGGTVLNTGTTSYTATTSSSDTGAYKIGSIKINDSTTDIYGVNTNTDTKVNVTGATTTKAYVLGMNATNTPTGTAAPYEAIADTGVYLDTTAGQLTATKFKGELTTESTIASSVAATTQTTGDDSTKVATTAFVHQDALCLGDTLTLNCI